MGYVLVENETAVPYSIQQLRDAHPNTSFPKHPSADSLAEYNVFPLNYDERPDFDIIEPGVIEQRIGGEGIDEDGSPIEGFYGWWQSWTGRDEPLEIKEAKVRAQRTNLLEETDFYGFSDVTMTSEMSAYRQTLRDVPSQEGFPTAVVWPTKPE